MVDHIKRLRDVKSDQTSPSRRLLLVEAVCHGSNNRENGGGRRTEGSETVLSRGKRKRRRVDKGKKETLKDLDSRGKEGDGR